MKNKNHPQQKAISLNKKNQQESTNKKQNNFKFISQTNTFKKSSKSKQSNKRYAKQQTQANLSFYLKEQNIIPTLKQAQNRQKQIKQFHLRTFYKKQKHFQKLFKQNCRIYSQLNQQTSFYRFQNQEQSSSILGRRSNSKKNRTNSVEIGQVIKQRIPQSISMNKHSFHGRSMKLPSPLKQKFQQVQYPQKQINNLLNLSNIKNFTNMNQRRYHRKNKTEFDLQLNNKQQKEDYLNQITSQTIPKQLMMIKRFQTKQTSSSTFIRSGLPSKNSKNKNCIRY